MLQNALGVLKDHRQIRFEVRGSDPNWPIDFRQEMHHRGMWHDFAPRSELAGWLARADAFLIPMVFDRALRRRMQTSFPSKLTEFAHFGKPLVIWGPADCSAAVWARQKNGALCLDNPDPNAFRAALERLATSTNEQRRLAECASQAAQTDFNPELLQKQFIELLERAAGRVMG